MVKNVLKYYDKITVEELGEKLGCTVNDLDPTPSEQVSNGEVEHICWCISKPQYMKTLTHYGYQVVELVRVENQVYITEVIGNKVINVEEAVTTVIQAHQK